MAAAKGAEGSFFILCVHVMIIVALPSLGGCFRNVTWLGRNTRYNTVINPIECKLVDHTMNMTLLFLNDTHHFCYQLPLPTFIKHVDRLEVHNKNI